MLKYVYLPTYRIIQIGITRKAEARYRKEKKNNFKFNLYSQSLTSAVGIFRYTPTYEFVEGCPFD